MPAVSYAPSSTKCVAQVVFVFVFAFIFVFGQLSWHFEGWKGPRGALSLPSNHGRDAQRGHVPGFLRPHFNQVCSATHVLFVIVFVFVFEWP